MRYAVLLSLVSSWALAEAPVRFFVDVKPGVTAESAYDVRAARKAFASAPAELFRTVRCSADCPRYVPTPRHVGHGFASRSDDEQFLVDWQADTTIEVLVATKMAPKGLKVLPWSSSPVVLMVSEDGAVFQGTRAQLSDSPPDAAVKNRFHALFPADVQWLEERRLLPEGSSSQLSAAIEAANACSRRIWDKAEPEFKKLEVANLTESARENRIQQLTDKTAQVVAKQCEKQAAAVDGVMGRLNALHAAP